MSIDSLTLGQFQQHRKMTVELAPGANTIVGPNGAGKTTLLRALYWLTFNDPSGMSFRHHRAKKGTSMIVRACIDGHLLKRKRSEDCNEYSLDREVYKALNRAVPQQVQELLNLDEVNFQLQHDSSFWFHLPPGQVSQQLNAIVNLGEIDKTLGNVATELRRTKMETGIIEERLEKAEERRRSLAWVLEADRSLRRIETLEQAWSETRLKRLRIDDLLREGRILVSNVERVSTALVAWERVQNLENYWNGVRQAWERLEELINQQREWTRQGSKQIPWRRWDCLETLRQNLAKISKKRQSLGRLMEQLKETEETLCQAEKSVTSIEKEWHERMGENCPLCGNPIPSY